VNARTAAPLRAYWRLRRWVTRALASRRTPLILLAVVCAFGTGARAWHLGIPKYTAPAQGYVFDERYYVSAARVIAGLPTPAGDTYANASPPGTDPNGEHPQLGKMLIAGSIQLFGDNSIAWRITPLAFGLAALLLLYWLVRSAGGSQWLALGTTAIASVDNLWLVHSRIAVLDIYAVPFMLAAAAFYLRRHPLIAGVLIGIGSCLKEFAVYTLFVLLLLEAMRGLAWLWARRGTRVGKTAAGAAERVAGAGDGVAVAANGPRVESRRRPWVRRPLVRRLARPLALCLVAGFTYFTVLTILDTAVTPYSGGHPVDRNQSSICDYMLLWKRACNHFTFMNRYAANLRDVGHPRGIASAPTDFWINRKVIPYYEVQTTVRVNGKVKSQQTIIFFRGEISRVLLFTSWLALAVNLWWAIRRRDDLSFLVIAWAIGTWLPTELFHAIDSRTTYLYYMVVVMPALYLAVARLLGVRRWLWPLVVIWAGFLLWDFASLYPFRTLSGS
jgi:Dolichyl-phosphate-mannose-protein mannosyltransferase